MDAMELLKHNPNVFVFADTPYWEVGSTLYEASVNHEELAKDLCSCKYWIATYDNNKNIKAIYDKYGAHSVLYELQYSASRKRKELEYMFYNDGLTIESFGKIGIRKNS